MTLLQQLTQSPVEALIFLFAIVVAVTIHEFAHAWTAVQLGDDTPEHQGRVTLNPLAHLDPLGSLCFVLLGFGWGKPVQYDPRNLRHHRDELLIALAGPGSNLLLAIGLNLLAFLYGQFLPQANIEVLQLASQVNVYLAAFNMIPIPPLDGSAIIAYFFPQYRSLAYSNFGPILLLLVLLLPVGGGNLLSLILSPVVTFFMLLTSLGGLL